MTRLDSAIRRLTSQRAVLDWAAREVISRPGLILELGLGNGRTYDHLRKRLPERKIYVFERALAAHPDCLPPPELLILGDAMQTLPAFVERMGAHSAVLIHADIGSGDEEENHRLALRLSPLIDQALALDGLFVADQIFDLPDCIDVSLEAGIEPGRYFAFQRPGPSRTVAIAPRIRLR